MITGCSLWQAVKTEIRTLIFSVRISVFEWTRRESNPCPKAYSLSFYYHSLLIPDGLTPSCSLADQRADTLICSVAS